MKTRNKFLVAGSAVLAVVLLSGFRGMGSDCGSGNPERMKQVVTWRLDDKLDGLKASEAQKQSIHALKDSLFAEGMTLREGQQGVREELLTQWEAANPDSHRVHQLVDERVEALRGFAHKLTDAALEAHRILTPEQRQQLSTEARERLGNR
jgi:Spy/CpxP family protein refolding chaperone